MIEDFKRSIDFAVRDRISSPFFGAFVFSWIVWNWRPIYVTLFVSTSKLEQTKLDYIVSNFANWNNQLVYPLISTVFLIVVYPWFNTAAMWVTMRYRKIYTDIKHREERRVVLTLEESAELRQKSQEREQRIAEMLKHKDEEIEKVMRSVTKERESFQEKLSAMQSESLEASRKVAELSLQNNNLSMELNKRTAEHKGYKKATEDHINELKANLAMEAKRIRELEATIVDKDEKLNRLAEYSDIDIDELPDIGDEINLIMDPPAEHYYNVLASDKDLLNDFTYVAPRAQNSLPLVIGKHVSINSLDFLTGNGLISDTKNPRVFQLTKMGRKIYNKVLRYKN